MGGQRQEEAKGSKEGGFGGPTSSPFFVVFKFFFDMHFFKNTIKVIEKLGGGAMVLVVVVLMVMMCLSVMGGGGLRLVFARGPGDTLVVEVGDVFEEVESFLMFLVVVSLLGACFGGSLAYVA